jgi:hypothetical protein
MVVSPMIGNHHRSTLGDLAVVQGHPDGLHRQTSPMGHSPQFFACVVSAGLSK